MKTNGPALLMTRPRDAAQRFLDLLPADLLSDLRVIHSPLMEITALPSTLKLDDTTTVVFTSGAGVRVASERMAERQVAYCVGQRTTEAALSAGWDARFSGETADALVANLLAARPSGTLLHLHGEYTRGAVVDRLAEGGLSCRGQVIYRQDLQPLSAEAEQALGAQIPLIVPLFSPRTAAHFASLCPKTAHLTLIAMSDAVAKAMPRLQSGALKVSKAPTAEAMADLLRDVVQSVLWVETDAPKE